MLTHETKTTKRLGWFVSTVRALTRCDTRREAEDLIVALGPKGEAQLHRECQCGCGQPAAKPIGKGVPLISDSTRVRVVRVAP